MVPLRRAAAGAKVRDTDLLGCYCRSILVFFVEFPCRIRLMSISIQQPTDFTLHTYTLSEVFEKPELITSLSSYSESRQDLLEDSPRGRSTRKETRASVLFLRVIAAADYYTTNKTLMQHVPPVDAEIILDPFLLNVLPRSLLPTGVYLVVLAIVAWYLSDFIWGILSKVAATDFGGEVKKRA